MTTHAHQAADANLIESIRQHAAWQTPYEMVERDGIILFAGATDFPGVFRNCVARTDPAVPAATVLQKACDFFGERKRGYTVFVRTACDADLDQEAVAQGYTLRSDSPCMLVDAPVPVPAVPAGIHIEPFSEIRHISDAARVNAEAYQQIGLAAAETLSLLADPARVLAATPLGFVAYRDGQPLATALTMLSADAAGVYWVGTAAAAQRSGLATICTALATNAGFEAGRKVVTLQASPFGEPVYRRLGYRTYDRLRWYRHLGAQA